MSLALTGLLTRGARRHQLAAPIAGAITGFLVVGLFDSLLDIPRIATLFLVLIVVALLLRNGSRHTITHHRSRPSG